PFVCGSAGRVLPDFEVCIQDDAGRPLPIGQTGEICVRGPSMMLGYWRNEQATAEAIIDGWLHSGDIGHLDERGYLYITDRKKDLIIKGGENISPREIEEALQRLPGVAEVAAFGVPDPVLQEDIAVAIVRASQPPLTAPQVQEFAAAQLSKFKVPRYVAFAEQLPKNSNGKVLKRSLRDQWKHT
ncbi:MAG: long-chain fatty acid--CoA ligase, partial [Planctomycetales bacterium]|nr:long-chain fatty acid--CoA ligase [Planctomycetales bacterium]